MFFRIHAHSERCLAALALVYLRAQDDEFRGSFLLQTALMNRFGREFALPLFVLALFSLDGRYALVFKAANFT